MIRARDVSRKRLNVLQDSAGEPVWHSRHVSIARKRKSHVGRVPRVDRHPHAELRKEPSPGLDQGVSARCCQRPRKTLQILGAHRSWPRVLTMNCPTSSPCPLAQCLSCSTTMTRPAYPGQTLGRGRRYRSDQRPRDHPVQRLGHCPECSLLEWNVRSLHRGGPLGQLIKDLPVCIANATTDFMYLPAAQFAS
jgi:hypothetical protein